MFEKPEKIMADVVKVYDYENKTPKEKLEYLTFRFNGLKTFIDLRNRPYDEIKDIAKGYGTDEQTFNDKLVMYSFELGQLNSELEELLSSEHEDALELNKLYDELQKEREKIGKNYWEKDDELGHKIANIKHGSN